MKNYLRPFLLVIVFVSCSNNDDDIDNQLVGSWNWLESSGGIAGSTTTPTSTGNTISVVISTNSLKQFTNGNLTFETNYTIEVRKSEIFGGQREMIIYENGFKQSFERKGNKLILYGECNDCFQSEYEKG
ncbi:MAG TPA: hypothetical protein DDZ39_02940 [Flavobacteriaceae bacterium]|nr:hypothetical protein [Flavobacteriaceae bacterium]